MAQKRNEATAGDDDLNLDQFDSLFDEAEESSFSDLPDGDYIVKVETVEMKKAKSGNPMLSIEFETVTLCGANADIGEETHSGRKQWKNLTFTEKNMGIAKGELSKLGITKGETKGFDKFSDLRNDAVLGQVLDREVWISRKTGKDKDEEGRPNVNVHIKGSLAEYEERVASGKAGKSSGGKKPAKAAAAAGEPEDDLSFD